jgi:hypothetical protein
MNTQSFTSLLQSTQSFSQINLLYIERTTNTSSINCKKTTEDFKFFERSPFQRAFQQQHQTGSNRSLTQTSGLWKEIFSVTKLKTEGKPIYNNNGAKKQINQPQRKNYLDLNTGSMPRAVVKGDWRAAKQQEQDSFEHKYSLIFLQMP